MSYVKGGLVTGDPVPAEYRSAEMKVVDLLRDADLRAERAEEEWYRAKRDRNRLGELISQQHGPYKHGDRVMYVDMPCVVTRCLCEYDSFIEAIRWGVEIAQESTGITDRLWGPHLARLTRIVD